MSRPSLLPNVSDKSRQTISNALAQGQKEALTPKTESGLRPRYSADNAGMDFGSGIESGLAILNGATGIINNFQQLNSIADTSQQQHQIDQMGSLGRYNVNSFDAINNQYGQLDQMQPNLDYDTIRGGSTAERIGGVASSALTGATTGFQVGGLYGAVAGGVLGLGAGIGGWLSGDQKAEDELKRLQVERDITQGKALQNINARMEELADYNFRNEVPRVRAEGGKIERKQTSLKDFADSISKRQRSDTTRSAGIVREYCNGGVKIRIKR
jgi:hypothetical protein